MTFIEKFNELKEKFGTIDESRLTDPFAVQIEMTDEDCGGIFYVAYMNGPFAVEPYDYHDHTAAITVSSGLLEDILSCKADPMEAFFAGNLKVDGDVGHALMLVELMKKEPKKEVKKETKKETKKEPKAKAAAEKEPAVKEKAPKTKKKEAEPAAKTAAPKKTSKKTTK